MLCWFLFDVSLDSEASVNKVKYFAANSQHKESIQYTCIYTYIEREREREIDR